jgi:hypothetical protein
MAKGSSPEKSTTDKKERTAYSRTLGDDAEGSNEVDDGDDDE